MGALDERAPPKGTEAVMLKRLVPGRTHRLVMFLLAAAATLPAPARAADVFQGTGKVALASFFRTDPSGCGFMDVFVSGQENTILNPPSGPQLSSVGGVTIFSFNSCTGELSSLTGFAAVQKIQIDGALTSAHLNATVNVCDSFSPSCFDEVVDMTWTASGKLQRMLDNLHLFSGPMLVFSKSQLLNRAATAVGTVPDGTQNFTPDPSSFALMGSGAQFFLVPNG